VQCNRLRGFIMPLGAAPPCEKKRRAGHRAEDKKKIKRPPMFKALETWVSFKFFEIQKVVDRIGCECIYIYNTALASSFVNAGVLFCLGA